MADIAKLKKKALEHEQKKQPDKALALYIQILEESSGASADEVDVSLYNRVGDLLVKQGNVGDAVGYYERAVDLYTEGGFLNNAIALCNKILRQSPGRTSIYYKLGKISAQKGFNSDARKNYLEYADRMQREGQVDEAFRALAEFCDLCPGQDDIRLMLADQLYKLGKNDQALAQLQTLYSQATADGRTAEAEAAAERMRAIDPSLEVTAKGEESKRQSKSDGLVFLDLDDGAGVPSSRRSSSPRATPPRVPALPELPPEPPRDSAMTRPTIATPITEMPQPLELTNQLEVPPTPESSLPIIEGFEGTNVGEKPAEEPPRFTLSQTPLSVDIIELDPVEQGKEDAAPASTGDLPLMDLTPSTPTPAGLPLLDVSEAPEPVAPSIEAPAPVEMAEDASSGGDLVFLTPLGSDVVTSTADASGAETSSPVADLPLLDESVADAAPPEVAPVEAAPIVASATPAGLPAFGAEYGMTVEPPVEAPEGADDIEVAFLTPAIVPALPEQDTSIREDEMITAALTPMASDVIKDEEPPAAPRRSSSVLARSVDRLAIRVADDPENWALRRSYAEALLEDGQRDAGLAELDVAMIGFEKGEELTAARSLADEIVRVNPSSVRHHQKRVEYCFRLSDRTGLVDAYLELGDALLREGQAEKARAVYQRVIELQPGNARAEGAIQTIATPPSSAKTATTELPRSRATTAVRSTTTMKRYTGAEPGAAPPAPAPEPEPAPVSGGDDTFVDLGDWLRDDEPTKDTRMVVDEEEPTGDEQADFADMLAKFKQGVAQNVEEEDYDSHYDLGVAYKEMGLLDEAIAEFQKALRGQQHRARAYEALGQCFVDKGHYSVASTILARAASEAGTDDAQLVGVLYLLGQTYEALERPADALAAYQRVFALDITFRDVSARIGAIEKAAK